MVMQVSFLQTSGVFDQGITHGNMLRPSLFKVHKNVLNWPLFVNK